MDRSLRSLPPNYAPSLVFSHGKQFRDQSFCTLFNENYHVRSIPEMRGMRCMASHYGWLLLKSFSSSECYLFDLVSLAKINLPPVIQSSYDVGCLTSSPSEPDCSVLLYSKSKKSIIFCRIGETQWIEQRLIGKKEDHTLIHDSCECISCNGKIYLHFWDVMVVIQLHNKFASLELYERQFLDYSPPGAVRHADFQVESCGEIIQVVVIFLGDSVKIVKKCDVFRLDFSTMKWVMVDTIGDDRVFLLAESSISISATQFGVKGNRIYFTLYANPLLYMFDMDDGTVTTTLSCPKRFPCWRGPFWVVPNYRVLEMNKEDAVAVAEVNREGKSWTDLPPELLQLIISSLSLANYMRFRLTCKTWKQITIPLRLNPPLVQSDLPWLMSFPNITKGVCNFYHPIYGDAYTLNIPELQCAYVHEAKYGWLLMSRDRTSMFFFNPLTTDTIKLPDLDSPYDFAGITFSSPPTSSGCMVFGHGRPYNDSSEMFYYEVGSTDATWSTYEDTFDFKFEFMASESNPVFNGGVFYCLSKDGKLGIFNPKEEKEQLVWQVMPVSPIFSYKTSANFETSVRSFLVECDDQILSIFVDFRGEPIWIYQLDRSETEMKWTEVDCLGDKVIFLSPTSCTMLTSGLKGIENRIYFSKFHGKNNVYYSCATRRYHCFECMFCGGNCQKLCEHMQCTWIQFL